MQYVRCTGARGRHDHLPSTCNHMFQRALSASLPSNTKLTFLISAKPSASVGSSYALSNPASTLLGSSPRAGCGCVSFSRHARVGVRTSFEAASGGVVQAR